MNGNGYERIVGERPLVEIRGQGREVVIWPGDVRPWSARTRACVGVALVALAVLWLAW